MLTLCHDDHLSPSPTFGWLSLTRRRLLHPLACTQGKVVFVAPTNPLVAQQLEACRSMMGVKQVTRIPVLLSLDACTRVL
jgi:hypothetical protein